MDIAFPISTNSCPGECNNEATTNLRENRGFKVEIK